MALIPPHDDWQVTAINNEVAVIQNGGRDDERVFIRLDLSEDREKIPEILREVADAEDLIFMQKQYISFWLGYFYAHRTWGM